MFVLVLVWVSTFLTLSPLLQWQKPVLCAQRMLAFAASAEICHHALDPRASLRLVSLAGFKPVDEDKGGCTTHDDLQCLDDADCDLCFNTSAVCILTHY